MGESGAVIVGQGGEARAIQAHEPLPGQWESFAKGLAEGLGVAEARERAGVSAARGLQWMGMRETAQRVVWLVRQNLELEAGRASAALGNLLNAESEKVRLDAALAILDRSGVGKAQENQSPVSVFIDLSSR